MNHPVPVSSAELALNLGASAYEVESAATHGFIHGQREKFLAFDFGWTFLLGRDWRGKFTDGLQRYRAAVNRGFIAG